MWLAVLGVSALVGTGTALALPAVLGLAVDAIVAGDGAGTWIAVAAGLVVAGLACELVDAYAGAAYVAGATAALRNALVRHVLAAGPRGMPGTGDLVSRVSGNAADAAQKGPATVSVTVAMLPPLGGLAMLTYLDVWIAVAFLAGLGVVALVLRAFTRRTADIVTAYQEIQGRIAGRLAESLTGIRTIAAAGTFAREERRILGELPSLREQGVLTWRALARSGAQGAVAGPLVLVAVLAVGGFALVDGRITAGELFAASRYAVLGAGLGGLVSVFGRLARARAGTRRTAEVFARPAFPYGTVDLPPGRGRLEFRDVTVRDPGAAGTGAGGAAGTGAGGAASAGAGAAAGAVPAGAVLLDRVRVVVPGGATVAVVGPSGAGKSVLAELAARLRDPDEGDVLLDGIPLRDLRASALRTAVGCAFDRPVLVGETVGAAIGPDRDRAVAAAHAVHAHAFVARLPDGYDTPLAAAPFSGGESQRLGLARAWHAERLLVLDDATSSLDTVTEHQISQALTSGAGRTRLIVTHRAGTAARADLVVWLDAGRIQAVGTHASLWRDPAYREVFS